MADDQAAGILARLEAILGRIPKVTDEDDHGGSEKPVPYAKFFTANQRAKAAEEALAALRGDVTALQTGYTEQLKAIQAAAAADVGRMAQQAAEARALEKLGLDDDGQAELRRVIGKLPEDKRPKSLPDYWSSTLAAVKAHRADPEKVAAPEVTRTLAGYLPADDKPADPAPRKTVGADRGVVNGQKSSAADKIGKAKTWSELMAAAEEADASR